MNKMSAFESKMAKFQQKKSVTNQGGEQQLNSSFSAMNNSISQKWAAINSDGKSKFGGLTGRPQTAGGNMMAQTLTAGMGSTAALNNSNNKFQSKLGGGLASRLENK
jgi:hypothetical protein